jgi:hypothetical protein
LDIDENTGDPVGEGLERVGLIVPPKAPLVGATPCPAAPGLDPSAGCVLGAPYVFFVMCISLYLSIFCCWFC